MCTWSKQLSGKNYPGGDLTGLDITDKYLLEGISMKNHIGWTRNGENANSVVDCKDRCKLFGTCMFITYVENENGVGGKCWLKRLMPDGNPLSNANDNTVSFKMECPGTIPHLFQTSSKVPGLRPGQTDITKEM